MPSSTHDNSFLHTEGRYVWPDGRSYLDAEGFYKGLGESLVELCEKSLRADPSRGSAADITEFRTWIEETFEVKGGKKERATRKAKEYLITFGNISKLIPQTELYALKAFIDYGSLADRGEDRIDHFETMLNAQNPSTIGITTSANDETLTASGADKP